MSRAGHGLGTADVIPRIMKLFEDCLASIDQARKLVPSANDSGPIPMVP